MHHTPPRTARPAGDAAAGALPPRATPHLRPRRAPRFSLVVILTLLPLTGCAGRFAAETEYLAPGFTRESLRGRTVAVVPAPADPGVDPAAYAAELAGITRGIGEAGARVRLLAPHEATALNANPNTDTDTGTGTAGAETTGAPPTSRAASAPDPSPPFRRAPRQSLRGFANDGARTDPRRDTASHPPALVPPSAPLAGSAPAAAYGFAAAPPPPVDDAPDAAGFVPTVNHPGTNPAANTAPDVADDVPVDPAPGAPGSDAFGDALADADVDGVAALDPAAARRARDAGARYALLVHFTGAEVYRAFAVPRHRGEVGRPAPARRITGRRVGVRLALLDLHHPDTPPAWLATGRGHLWRSRTATPPGAAPAAANVDADLGYGNLPLYPPPPPAEQLTRRLTRRLLARVPIVPPLQPN